MICDNGPLGIAYQAIRDFDPCSEIRHLQVKELTSGGYRVSWLATNKTGTETRSVSTNTSKWMNAVFTMAGII